MSQAVGECQRLWPGRPIELGAQAHLRDFYGSFGFHAISDVYDEDGIPHVDMRRDAAT
jgi:ElaA protein